MRILERSDVRALGLYVLAMMTACSASPGPVATEPTAPLPPGASQVRWHPEPVSLTAVRAERAVGVHIDAAAAAWPPPSYDKRLWVGASESTARYLPGPTESLISEVGCPFQPAPLPSCADLPPASAVDVAITAEEWHAGSIVAVEGTLRIGQLQPAAETGDPKRYQRQVTGLEVCGTRTCVHLAASNQPSLENFSPYWCMFDNSGVCCGFQYNRRVIARGRVMDWLGPTLEKALLCAVSHDEIRYAD
jgi:hypothetical protein